MTFKIAIIQRVIPHYRVDFFRHLYEKLPLMTVLHSSSVTDDGLVKDNDFPFPDKRVSMFDKFICYQSVTRGIVKSDYEFVVLGLELKIISNHIVWFLSRIKQKRVVWWTHGYNVHIKNKGLRFFLDRMIKTFLMKRCHKVLLYTDYNLEELISRGIPRKKIIVFNNTINEKPHQVALKQVTCDNLEKAEGKTRESRHTLLFIGRLTGNKRVDLLLDMAAKLTRVYSDLRVFIIGDGDERLALEEIKEKLGLNRHVFFLGTINEPEKLAPYFKLADFSVLPGAVGLSIVQSFIYGVPFLTLRGVNHGPEVDYLKSNYNGYVAIDMNDMEKWLIEHFDNPQLKAVLKKNCLDCIKREVNLDHMVSQFSKTFMSETLEK